MTFFLLYPAIGVLAGLLAGLFGIGGGLVIVPALVHLFQAQGLMPAYTAHFAVGTSLAVIVPTALVSLLAHHRRGSVDAVLVARMAPPVFLGALGGAWLATRISTEGLGAFFGLFEMIVAVQMLASVHHRARFRYPGTVASSVAGLVIGGLSAMLGIGGGTLSVPFLAACGVPMVRAIGTSAALGLPLAVAGVAAFVGVGFTLDALPPGATGFVYWPAWLGITLGAVVSAPLGARLAHRLQAGALKRAFAILLALVGGEMAFS